MATRIRKTPTMEDRIKSGLIDLTKTGPLTYRELQRLNNSLPEESEFNQQLPNRPGTAVFSPAKASQINYTGIPTDYGESVYDSPLASDFEVENYQDLRGERQPWYAQIGAGLAKGAVLAGTTFLDGTVGLIVGAATAINEGRWSGLWDNDFSRAMQAVNEWSEEVMPNYYTDEELNGPWYSHINANFIGDKFIKNLGFSVGALYSGSVWTKPLTLGGKLAQAIGLVSKASKAPAAVNTLVGAGISSLNEGRIEALNNSKDWYELQKAQLDDYYRGILTDIQSEYESTAGQSLVGGSDGRYSDPAYEKYKSSLADADRKYQEALAKMNEDRAKMGNMDMLMNLPILMASNVIQFGKFYANGYKTARKTSNIVGNMGNYATSKSKAGGVLAVTKGALSEGLEEISQGAASRISGDYYATDVSNFYKSKFDPNAEQETLSWMKSFAQGINETVNDGSSWEEFFIGTLTGALGIPTFKKKASGRYGIGIEGGAVNGYNEYREQMAREQEIADYMNARVQSPEFLNYYQGLIRHNKYQNDMNQAVADGDEFEFKNAEHAQFISDITMFDNAGKLGDLKTLISKAYDTSDENFDAIIRNTTSVVENEDGSKSLAGPYAQYAYLDDNGQIASNLADEFDEMDMANKLTQSRDDMMNTIKEYQKIKDDIDIRTGQRLTDEQLEELTWMKSQLSNWSKRAVSVSGEVKSAIGNVIGNLHSFLRFHESIRDFEGRTHAGLTDRYNTADKNARKISKAIDTLNSVRNQDDEALAFILSQSPKFVDGLIEEIDNLDNTVLSEDEKQDLSTKLRDIVKLGNASKTYNEKLKEYLDNPEKQVEAHQQAQEQAAKNEADKQSADLRQALSNAQNMQQFREAVSSSEDPATTESILKEMEDEGSQLAKNYKEVEQYNREVKRKIDESGASEQEKQDALKLLQDQYNYSESLEQIANPNSVFVTNENAFDEEANSTEEALDRFRKAQYVLQDAMSKANEDTKFKDRFSAPHTTPGAEDLDPATVRGDDRGVTGDSGTSTIPPVNAGAPVNTYQPPVGNIQSDAVLAENKETNGAIDTPQSFDSRQGNTRRYYRPAIPELHIEASKDGDFRPFNVVASEREGANFDAIYNHLADNGAFEYINNGNLQEGDEIGFMIDPAFEEKVKDEPWHTQPTIFLVTKDGQIVGSLDESPNSVSRYEGLAGLQEKVRKEYKNSSSGTSANQIRKQKYNEARKQTTSRAINAHTLSEEIKAKEKELTEKFKDKLEAYKNAEEGSAEQAALEKEIEDALPEGFSFNIDRVFYSVSTNLHNSTLKDPNIAFSVGTYVQINQESTYPVGVITEVDNNGRIIEVIDEDGNLLVKDGKILTREETIKAREAREARLSATGIGRFTAAPRTKVSRMMTGRVAYDSNERNLASIPGVMDSGSTPIFGIIKNGTMSTNGMVSDDKIIKPVNMAGKEGRMYLLIPNGAGKYSPAAVRVKHFNDQEFDLDNITVASTPIGKDLKDAIRRMANSMSEEDLASAVKDLNKVLYTGNLHIDYFTSKKGNGIRITQVERDADGYEIYDETPTGRKRRETSKPIFLTEKWDKTMVYAIVGDNNVETSPDQKSATQIEKEIKDVLMSFNLPLQVSISELGKKGYVNRILNSGILTSNIQSAKVVGNWFTMDYFDAEGNLQSAVSPASVKPESGRTPVGGKESVVSGIPVQVGNSIVYVDLERMVITQDGKSRSITSDDSLLVDLAWAQDNFGNATNSATMKDNKVVTPSGKVLDRTTQRYLNDAEAQRVKDDIAGRNADREARLQEAERVISQIGENQKNIDKNRTDGEYYYVLEDDGKYHQYDRVHSRIGSNWVESQKQTEALTQVRTNLSKFVDSPSQFDNYLQFLENKYKVKLDDFKGKTDARSRDTIANIVRDRMAGTNSQRALDAGTAVDSVIRQYFTIKDVSKITKPSNMSESAYLDLLERLRVIKESIENRGERFITDNVVLYVKYPDGTRIAGEVDILALDRDGNFKIYDVKTSRYSFHEFEDKNHRKVNYFKNPSPTQRMSTEAYYTLQLSAYKNLFESQYHLPVTQIGIMPFVLGYEKDMVTSITGENGIPLTYNPAVSVPLIGTTAAPVLDEQSPVGVSEASDARFEKDGKIVSAPLKKVATIGGVDVFIYKEPVITKGFGRPGEEEHIALYNYWAVFPNGKSVEVVRSVSPSVGDDIPTQKLIEALSAKPKKVQELASEVTMIGPTPAPKQKNAPTILPDEQNGAKLMTQEEQRVNTSTKWTRKKLRAIEGNRPVWNQEKELKWLEKVLPQLSREQRVSVVKGLIKVAEKGPAAWGQFEDGMVTLSSEAAQGTAYHEAFHVVFNTLLDQSEIDALYAEAKAKFGDMTNDELEEHMADDFMEYTLSQDKRGLGRRMLDFFKALFDKITNWRYVKPSLTNYYRMINQGKYANSDFKVSPLSTQKSVSSWSSMSQENRETLSKKGWTEEQFNSVSQEEREQALRCLAF